MHNYVRALVHLKKCETIHLQRIQGSQKLTYYIVFIACCSAKEFREAYMVPPFLFSNVPHRIVVKLSKVIIIKL